MIAYYKDFEIHVNDDLVYTPNSADNCEEYDKSYVNNKNSPLDSKYGIRVFQYEKPISSAIICEGGIRISIGIKSFLVTDDAIFICCSDMVYALTLPSLDLKWRKQLDFATCFGIHKFEGDFVIHGEVDISRITSIGEIVWEFSGRDIFVNTNGHREFEIVGQQIKLVDYQNHEYIIDINGKLISDRLLS